MTVSGKKTLTLYLSGFQNSWMLRFCDHFYQADYLATKSVDLLCAEHCVIETRYLGQKASFLASVPFGGLGYVHGSH